jgi:hypothetical protein
MLDLQTLIPAGTTWQLYAANGISDNGMIVGEGLHDGLPRGFLLTPMNLHCSADFDGDGSVATDADIGAFFECLAGSCCPRCGSADFNADGTAATDADIESFFRVLAGGPC